MQIPTDEGQESNNKLIKSARSSKRIDPSRRQDFNNLTSPSDKNIDNLSEGDTIDVNRIYTPWSRWSRCSRKCKQKRERRCAVPQICGSAVVRMERGCHSDRCRGRDFHIVRKRKKLGRKTKVTINEWSIIHVIFMIMPGSDAEKPGILLQVEQVEPLHWPLSHHQGQVLQIRRSLW